jgi:hypothetical protein
MPMKMVITVFSRVAKWHIFKPKIPIKVNFGGPCNGRCYVKFMAIWSILRPFGIFYSFLVYFPRFGMLYQEIYGNPGFQHDHAKMYTS